MDLYFLNDWRLLLKIHANILDLAIVSHGFLRRMSAGNSVVWNSVNLARDAANYSDERSTRELCNEKNSCRPRFPVISKVSDRSQPTNEERVIINATYCFSLSSRFSLWKDFIGLTELWKKSESINRARGRSTCRITEKKVERDYITILCNTRVSHEIQCGADFLLLLAEKKRMLLFLLLNI